MGVTISPKIFQLKEIKRKCEILSTFHLLFFKLKLRFELRLSLRLVLEQGFEFGFDLIQIHKK